jgi:hypothetical protein
MTITAKVLYTGGQLTGSAVTYYTSPANTTTVVTQVVFTNVDTVARLITVYIVRAAGTAGAANTLIDAYSIPPTGAYVSPELVGVTLNAGDFIQALADVGAKVTVSGIYGYQIY